ncbi:membrane-bound metal-dependent hydrolase YbcI (DUF457 family) [Methanofollis sp. W23]|uniref:metal-dependent hydrolase n=1 Tax=Methanofollis sp. W23 TaxID=2817849 RepID=UPI001AE66C14|nr:metal-dependent hydrolase [Methanofollis sp. W23]MBP2146382.1 membrane-bound metal-dependent hydrolase YbcI (DUF457 family) [Methanofollis sp. W23]
MFFLCHLAAGVVIGILLARLFRDLRAVPACAFGAVVPDLIDKPLGHIILADTLQYGRIYTHGLLALSIVTLVGLLLYWRYRSGLGLALAVGIGSHQVLDAMWREPANWLYPFLGPFTTSGTTSTFHDLVMAELSEPSEWIFFLFILFFGVLFLKKSWRKTILSRSGKTLEKFAVPVGILLIIFGGFLIFSGLFPLSSAVTHLQAPADIALCGLIIVAAGIVLAWARALVAHDKTPLAEKEE